MRQTDRTQDALLGPPADDLRALAEADAPEGHVAIRLAELAEHNADEVQSYRHREHGGLLWVGTFTALALVAVGLATYGHYRLELNPNGAAPPHLHWYSAGLFAFFDALKLFPSGFPGHTTHRATIQIAEWLAAIVSLSITGRLLYLLYADHLARMRARLRRGHAVVCGIGEKGVTIIHALQRERSQVNALDLDPNSGTAAEARAARAIVLRGDALHAPALRSVAAARARKLVCASGDDDVNAAIASRAMAIAAAQARSDPLELFVHIANPDLAALVRPTTKTHAVRLQVINVDEQQARRLAQAVRPLAVAGGSVAVLGTTALVRPLVVEIARAWHAHRATTPTADRLEIAVIDPRADVICAAISSLYPAVPRCAELVPLPATAPFESDTLARLREREPAIVFVCLPTVAERTALALRLRHPYTDDAGPNVVVPVSGHEHTPIRLLADAARIYPIGLSSQATGAALLRDSIREILAEAVHGEYLAHVTAKAEAPGPASVPWERLAEQYRDINRRHADGVAVLLSLVWLEIVALVDWDAPITPLNDEQVECLAELEHMRWCFEHRRDGWVSAPTRDEDAKRHDLLVPWDDLAEDAREKDRVLVRSWPRLLAAAGYDLRHTPARETLARRFNAMYCDVTGSAAGASADELWNALGESARAATRASVDDIGVKAAICDRGIQKRRPQGPVPVFSTRELERLARREHERWMRERTAAGWRFGAQRDNEHLLHPDLVPWDRLPEDRREIDRRLIEGIPSMLAAAGLELTEPFNPASTPRRAARMPLLRFRTISVPEPDWHEIPPWLR